MSVYTPLSLARIQQFAAYNGLDIVQADPILEGIENSSWFLTEADGSMFVLTVFEALNTRQARHLGARLIYLAAQGLPVAAPLTDKNGQFIRGLAQKPAFIAPRLSGQHPTFPTLDQCTTMGSQLAKLHVALAHVPIDLVTEDYVGATLNDAQPHKTTVLDINSIRKSQNTAPHLMPTTNIYSWQTLVPALKNHLSAADKQLLEQIFSQFAQWRAPHYSHELLIDTPDADFSMGLIHGDLFRDNSLFVENHLTGIVDFSECHMDDLLMDVAITVNDFSTHWITLYVDQARHAAFINAYETVRPLSAAEREALHIYQAMAACRFWLSRLHIRSNSQEPAHSSAYISTKNPDDMRELARYYLANYS